MQACARGFEADTPLGPSPAMRCMQVELSGAVQCSEVQRTRLFRVGSAGAGRRCSSTRGLRGLAVEEARAAHATLRELGAARAGDAAAAALRELGAPPGAAAPYRLEVLLDDEIAGFGIRRDDAVTRERRTLRARYRLVDSAKGTVLLDATAGSDAGIDVVGSEYATIAAENTALERLSTIVADQIVARVAVHARAQTAAP